MLSTSHLLTHTSTGSSHHRRNHSEDSRSCTFLHRRGGEGRREGEGVGGEGGREGVGRESQLAPSKLCGTVAQELYKLRLKLGQAH